VSAAEKRELHELLLSAGIPIGDVNAVRKQVSAFKGGRLALAAAPASVLNLTVSDVAGDRLDVLTDPSVQDGSTPAEALAILAATGLTGRVAPSILDHLEGPEAGTPDLSGVDVEAILLVTGATACEAMTAAAIKRGYETVVLGTDIEGEARRLGGSLAAAAIERAGDGPAVFIGCGGEATVDLGAEGAFGAGGPNQEAALAAAAALAGREAAAVFLDTDGSDGGTGLAGAVADGATRERAIESGLDLEDAIASHRSGEAVAALRDGIVTGPTHTNVNDLFVIATR
jgi:glycerate-2-kinase